MAGIAGIGGGVGEEAIGTGQEAPALVQKQRGSNAAEAAGEAGGPGIGTRHAVGVA